MVYQLDTPGLEDQAVTTQKIDTGAVTLERAAASVTNALVPIKGIIMFSGTAAEVPANWSLCDGSNGTPDLRNKFVISSQSYDTGDNRWETNITGTGTATGGSKDSHLPSHTHGINTSGNATLTDPGHNHGITEPNSGNGHKHSISFTNTDSGFGRSEESGSGGQAGTNDTNFSTTGITIDDNTTGITLGGSTESQGSSNVNQNLPPYFALAFIMRVT